MRKKQIEELLISAIAEDTADIPITLEELRCAQSFQMLQVLEGELVIDPAFKKKWMSTLKGERWALLNARRIGAPPHLEVFYDFDWQNRKRPSPAHHRIPCTRWEYFPAQVRAHYGTKEKTRTARFIAEHPFCRFLNADVPPNNHSGKSGMIKDPPSLGHYIRSQVGNTALLIERLTNQVSQPF